MAISATVKWREVGGYCDVRVTFIGHAPDFRDQIQPSPLAANLLQWSRGSIRRTGAGQRRNVQRH
jgi:hypothetical protein